MKSLQRGTLKRSLFTSLLFFSVVIILLFGTLTSIIWYHSGVENAYSVIRNRNQADTNYIKGYFMPLRSAVQYLAKKKVVVNAAEDTYKQKEKTLSLFKTLENSIPNIYYIYAGYKDKTLLINNYTPPKDYDPTTRPWYRAALNSAPKISGGIPYREIKTNEWLVSLSKVLHSDNETVKGVVTIDASLKQVNEMLSERDPNYSSSYSYVLNEKGELIIHHRSELLGKKINKIVRPAMRFSGHNGRESYTFEQKDKIAYYTRIDTLGWIVVTVINKKEILEFVANRILISIGIVILFTLLIVHFMSRMLSKNLILPMRKLEQRVKSTISGSDQTHHYDETSDASISPHKEINFIAGAIEQVTEQALFRKNQELEAKNEQLKKISTTDHLTGLLNRRKITENIEKEYQRARRYNNTFSTIIIDIDWFKKINDEFGHQAGDQVLKECADIFTSKLRNTDSVGRWGGEEFLILCPETNLEGAELLAKRIKNAFEQNKFSVPKKITISAGVCEYQPDLSLQNLLTEADNKLYEAKSQGRNKVSL